MSNAQDLLALLGGAPAGAVPRAAADAATSILSFKAGKMTTTLKPNGKYRVEPDLRRGELHVVWTTASSTATTAGSPAGHLQIEWRDRRTQTAVDAVPIFADDDATFERVLTGREDDRVYLLQCGGRPESRHFFWMQDKDPGPDDELVAKANLYLADPSAASSAAAASAGDSAAVAPANDNASGAMDQSELLRLMQGALGASGEGGSTTTVPGADSIPTGQIDALGTILEGLGAPALSPGEGTAAAGAATAGGLTLGDLQSAMAGLDTASATESAGEEGKEEEKEGEEEAQEEAEEAETSEEPPAEARLIVLVSNGVCDVVQAANQREALRLLDDLRVPHAQIDGMDPERRETRNALFAASGIRGNYPQIFTTTGTDEEATYLGGYEWLHERGAEELRGMVPAGATAGPAAARKPAAEAMPTKSTEGKRALTLLVSNGVFDVVQAANQRDAVRLLDDLAIPYETIDGMDPAMRERRNELFEISGVRGNYPQIFIAAEEEGDALKFLGGYEWLSEASPDELNELVKNT
ncbi:hypothetical protein ACHAXT_002032 [Thalassiosira profunda]